MDNELELLKKIRQVAMESINDKYEKGRAAERVISVGEYDELPITAASNSREVPIVLEEVIVVTKQKILENADLIPAYEVYDRKANKLLETMDDGRIKLDREIMEDKIANIVKAIEDAGYKAAGMSSLDQSGRIESFFEMVNGKLTAINEEQKEKIERSDDREEALMEVSGETLDSKKGKEITDAKVSEQNKVKDGNQVEEELQEQGIDAVKVTEVIDDPIFRNENNLSNARAVLTRDGRTEIVEEINGKYQKAEGFGESHSRAGEVFAASNDENAIGDQIHTYGGVSNGEKEYSIILDNDGKTQLAEKIRNKSGARSQNEEFVAFKVQNKGMADYEINKEGYANGENITARTRDIRSTNRDQNYDGDGSGRGGVAQIANANKNHSGRKDYTMDDFSAHTNPKFDDALEKFHDVLKKNGISLDPDVEANVQRRIETFVEQSNQPFCEEMAESYALDAQMLQRNQEKDAEQENEEVQEVEEKEERADEGRNRLEEARRRH